jgi:putative transposase
VWLGKAKPAEAGFNDSLYGIKRTMPLVICYYHVVWATKHRTPHITADIEPIIFSTIRRKSEALKSPIHAINGVEDHIHEAISLSAHLALAEWVRHVKGLSAHEVNQNLPNLDTTFRWQSGYSAHTFGQNALPKVVAYIRHQKKHHAEDTIITYLETLEDESHD